MISVKIKIENTKAECFLFSKQNILLVSSEIIVFCWVNTKVQIAKILVSGLIIVSATKI